MKVLFATVVLALVASTGAELAMERSPAIQKVVQMMGDMQAKAKKEKADEEVAFAEFNQWCKMEQDKLGKSIKKSGSMIEALGTSIGKLTDEAKKLGEDVGKLQNQIAKHEADMKAHKNTRAKEHAAYVTESTDYGESVSAVERALEVMSKHDGDGAAALLQVSQTSRMPEKAKDVIAAFLGEDADGFGDYAAPEAAGYESQSGGVVNMLKNLLDDFRAQKSKCDKEEANSKHAHDMVMMDLADTVAGANKDSSQKSQTRSQHQTKAALDKKQKASTEGVLAEDENTLKDVSAQCSEKQASFTEKQQLRADEIEAIGKAISIMQSSDVSGFIQSTAQANSFAQLRSGTAAASEGRRHDVREFLTKESLRLKSHTLSLLAETLQADPFAKVKGMIKDMVTKLLKEANADAEQEGFCDTEMGKSKATRTQLTEDIDSLTASIEDAKAEIMALTESNADLAQGISDLTEAVTKATSMRVAEKKKNEETVVDAEAAVKAVDAATAVLTDFYKKASVATALVQGGSSSGAQGIRMGSDEWDALGDASRAAPDPGHKKGQQTFGDTYKGNQDGATGVLAMIEVIRSDFANLAADTKNGEEEALTAFEEFIVESKRNSAVKSKKLDLNEADKASTTRKMQEDSKDLKSNQDELVAAQRYFSKLQAQCVDKGSSYEDRTKARAAEIQSLKEALQMLS